MRFRYAVIGAALAALATTPTAGLPSVPSPVTSYVDPVAVLCPGGDVGLHVVVRDINSLPIAGATLDVSFQGCPDFSICPLDGTEPYLYDPIHRSVRVLTDLTGQATIPVRAGGVCFDSVFVYADGVLIAHRPLASPDQNGDLSVDGTDALMLQSKVGTTDPTGDLDGDGTVTAADLAVQQAHVGHVCPNPTPARPSSWGRVKTIYR